MIDNQFIIFYSVNNLLSSCPSVELDEWALGWSFTLFMATLFLWQLFLAHIFWLFSTSRCRAILQLLASLQWTTPNFFYWEPSLLAGLRPIFGPKGHNFGPNLPKPPDNSICPHFVNHVRTSIWNKSSTKTKFPNPEPVCKDWSTGCFFKLFIPIFSTKMKKNLLKAKEELS